jgi:hypothetical protein
VRRRSLADGSLVAVSCADGVFLIAASGGHVKTQTVTDSFEIGLGDDPVGIAFAIVS